MTAIREILRRWKPRSRTSHKGDFGRVFILAGSEGLTGAAYLSSLAAIRSGAGLLTLGVPEKIYPILARRHAEVMVRPFPSTSKGTLSEKAVLPILKFLMTQDVLAIGPGLSQLLETQRGIRRILSGCPLPAVVDADALNAMAGRAREFKKWGARAILTPHPGEFARVFGKKVPSSDSERKKMAAATAKRFGFYLVLKGHHTVVADPDGKTYVNETGNPGMAKGGSGDVLTGVLAALLGQGLSLWDAARLGVYVHGLAGDLALKRKGEVSMIATDIIDALPAIFRKTRHR